MLNKDKEIQRLRKEVEKLREKIDGKNSTKLSKQERRVLELVWNGLPTKAMAANLGLAFASVKNIKARLAKKLQVSTTAEIIRAAIEKGHIKLPQQLEWQQALIRKTFNHRVFEQAPCYICNYNGPEYYQPSVHKCAEFYHEVKS